MPSLGKATNLCSIVLFPRRAVTGGITAYTEFSSSRILIVSSPIFPLPRCIFTPALESGLKLRSISNLLLDVGPTPAGLTAV